MGFGLEEKGWKAVRQYQNAAIQTVETMHAHHSGTCMSGF